MTSFGGKALIPWENDDYHTRAGYKRHYLSHGLSFLRLLATTQTYEQRHKLLNPFQNDHELFSEILDESNPSWANIFVSQLSDEAPETLTGFETLRDPDPGPWRASKWAYHEHYLADAFHGPDHRELRERGYVFFDHGRLSDWNFYAQPLPFPLDKMMRLFQEASQRRVQFEEAMYESWSARSKIWKKGGRGWWVEGDESKIRWTNTAYK